MHLVNVTKSAAAKLGITGFVVGIGLLVSADVYAEAKAWAMSKWNEHRGGGAPARQNAGSTLAELYGVNMLVMVPLALLAVAGGAAASEGLAVVDPDGALGGLLVTLPIIGATLTGRLRWARFNRQKEMAGTPSPAFPAQTADNVAPPRVIFNARSLAGLPGHRDPGTDQDERYEWLMPAAELRGEYYELQYLEATARTLTTANCKSNFSVSVAGKNHLGQMVARIEDRDLTHRITKTGVNPTPLGLPDNPVTTASEWSSAIRFAPRQGSGEVPWGFAELLLDGV